MTKKRQKKKRKKERKRKRENKGTRKKMLFILGLRQRDKAAMLVVCWWSIKFVLVELT